jgi:hypothetical protein
MLISPSNSRSARRLLPWPQARRWLTTEDPTGFKSIADEQTLSSNDYPGLSQVQAQKGPSWDS